MVTRYQVFFMTLYETNRAKFSLADLQPYSGQWVAFSVDGSRILASAPTIAELDRRLTAVGEDLKKAAVEMIDFEDSRIGGAELI